MAMTADDVLVHPALEPWADPIIHSIGFSRPVWLHH